MAKADLTIKIEELLQQGFKTRQIMKVVQSETTLSESNLERQINKTRARMVKRGELITATMTAPSSVEKTIPKALLIKIEGLILDGASPTDIANTLHPLYKSEYPEWGKFLNIVIAIKEKVEPTSIGQQKYNDMRERAKSESEAPPTQAYKIPGTDAVFKENLETGEAELNQKSKIEIKSLDDLIRECCIDTAIWDIEKYECNKWAVGMKMPKGDGTFEVVVTPLFQIKAFLRKKSKSKDQKLLNFKADLLADLANISPVVDKLKLNNKKGVLLELDIFDPHFGKLAWAPETGESYDLKIAEDRYYAAVHELLKRAEGYNIKQILYPIGNDMLHYDNLQIETTAGTKQDSDVRYQKMYRKCVEIVIKTAEICAKIAPLEIYHICGNHDQQTGFYLAETISAYFRNNKNIIVNTDIKQRKYYRWGKCGIGFTHGNNEKHSDLPQIMMREMQKTWKGEVDFMEWHLGHFHKKKQVSYLAFDENHGISIRVLRSLSAPDAWHYAKGYVMGLKGAEAFIWDKDHGNIANISSILI